MLEYDLNLLLHMRNLVLPKLNVWNNYLLICCKYGLAKHCLRSSITKMGYKVALDQIHSLLPQHMSVMLRSTLMSRVSAYACAYVCSSVTSIWPRPPLSCTCSRLVTRRRFLRVV